ncbi:unnamed protein product [Ixodes hexagonus]
MSRFPDHSDWVRSFYVSNPTLHKKGYTIYKVVSKVFPKNSVEAASQVIVWKRYSDFSKLYKALLLIYQGLHLKGNFPKFAKAQFFGRFEEDVVEERRQSALRLLEFAAKYPVLFNSQVFVKFFERSEEVNDEPEQEMSGLDPPLLAPPAKLPSKFNGISAEAWMQEKSMGAGAGDSLSERSFSRRITALDQLSLDSRTTEDEIDISVRSATTEGEEEDDVCNVVGPPSGLSSSDLAMFDPILQSQESENEGCPSLSNTWILSAAGVCANLAEETGSPPRCAFSFPKPFQDLSPNDDDDWLRLQEGRATNISPPEARRGDGGADAESAAESLTPGTPVSPLDVGDAAYLQAAANWASRAHSSEVQGDFLGAFSHYKAAVGALLEGVQGDRNAGRRDAVRRKTAQYLARAEYIYESQLSQRMGGERRWSLSAAPVPQPAPPVGMPFSSAPLGPRPSPFLGSSLRGAVQELARYKVIGIVGNVLLALDTEQSATVVIKVLHKSPSGPVTPVPSVVPQEVPHMVRLLRVYETDCALFLVLEYATGGRLWDYLGSYVCRHELEPMEQSPACLSDHGALGAPPRRRERSPCPPSHFVEEKATLPLPSDCDIANCGSQWSLPATPARDLSSVDKGRVSLDDALSCEYKDPNQLLADTPVGHVENSATSLSETTPFTEGLPKTAVVKTLSLSISEQESLRLDQSLKAMILFDEGSSPHERIKNFLKAEDNSGRQTTAHVADDGSRSAENTHRETSLSGEQSRMSDLPGEGLSEQKSESSRKASEQERHLSADDEPVEHRLSHRAAEAFRHLDGMVKKMAPPRRLPEACVRQWAAEMALALCHLHRLGVVRQDLCPHDILLADGGHIVLTYCCQFNCVDHAPSQFSRENQYSAPEIDQLGPVTPACDWWSFGAILYELFVGAPLIVCHPGGVTSTTRLSIPSHVSIEAADLLEKLLAYHPHQRLGHGPTGSEDVRCHPFFATVDWAHMASR